MVTGTGQYRFTAEAAGAKLLPLNQLRRWGPAIGVKGQGIRKDSNVKTVAALIALSALLLLAGCGTSISTNYDYDVNARFADYKTFDWQPGPEVAPGNANQARQSNDLLDKRIKTNVEAVLKDQGMTRNTNTPDIRIVYYTGVKDKVQVTDWGYRYSDAYWGWGGRDIDVYNYEEGTLIIDFIDVATTQLVWRGAGKVAIDSGGGGAKADDELVRKVVGKILSKYPPQR